MNWTWKGQDSEYFGPWKNGLPSGWKTTSIFGSLFNSFIIKAILEVLNIEVSYLATHGDDTDLELKTISEAILIS